MTIKIHSLKFDADQKLIDFVNQKVNKLSLFDEYLLNADVSLRLDKDQEGDNKICEIKLDIPGGTLFAKRQCKSFEEATDETVDALKRQIIKNKEKKKGI